MAKDLILVTGSSGLIGRAMCQTVRDTARVVGLDMEGIPYPPPEVEWIFVDLTSDESTMNALHVARDCYGSRIASVCHLAAFYDFSGEPSDMYEKVTIRGTERLLRELKRFFEVEQFIFSSTMLVHAPTEPGTRIDENSPIIPKWDYPKSKVETERLILAEHDDIPVVMLRIAGVYDNMCHSIPLAHQIQRIHQQDFTGHVFPGNPEAGQSFVHLDDVIRAFTLAIEKRHDLPEELTLLIGEPKSLAYAEIQEKIGRLLYGKHWETTVIPKPLAKVGAWVQDNFLPGEPFIKPWMIDLADDHYELDISRAQEILGWEPRRTLSETLPKMIGALERDPIYWYETNHLEMPEWLKRQSA